ncbi:hypothetical protein KJ997_04615, partial [bacterium]|nr:hypothetical protein [bacterium]
LSDKLLPEFWLAYINSAFVSWYVYNFVYARAIRTMDFYNFYIQQIPIPQKALEKSNQKEITSLVEKIHTAVQSNNYLSNVEKQAQVKEYERQIDHLVYELYGLTKDEITIVENSGER